jgi:DNA-binding LacI/PurR family transcriptional regulator
MEKKPLVKEVVAEKLKEYINKERSDTQIKISSERELSEYFNVSRITLRSAIKDLVNEGILVQIKGKGTYITPRNEFRSIHLICSPKIKNNDPFYLKFLSELTDAASKQSLNIFIVDPEQINPVSNSTPLVIIGLFEDNHILDQLIAGYKQIIAIQDYSSYNDVISQIYFNDYKIGWQAAHLLADYHHTKLLLLAGPEKYPSSLYRKKGFLDGLDGLELKAAVYTEKMNWAGGYHAGEYLLAEVREEERPTAVFATNDWMAIGFMQKLKESGIMIPDDISVVGCDDIPLGSEFIPTLTTFNLDMKYLVMELFSLMNKIAQSKEDMTRKIVLPANLIIRESIKKL